MAAALDPNEALRSTAGKGNFQRVARLLISGGTSLLREIFDAKCPPSQLPTILSKPSTEKLLKAAKLNKPQWNCLYPTPGVYGKSTDFDVTLLFRLLRTICNLTPPTTGWDSLPAVADHSLTADLARVKYYRNAVYGHVNQTMEVRDYEFPSLWQDISEALIRIAAQISSEKETEWRKAIDKLLKDPLTVEDQRNVQELERWYENDMVVKESIKDLKCSTREGMDHMERTIEKTTKEVMWYLKDIKNQVEKVYQTQAPSTLAERTRLQLEYQEIPRPSISTDVHSETTFRNTSDTFPNSSEDRRISEPEARNKQKVPSFVQLRNKWEGLTVEPESTHSSKRAINKDMNFETYASDQREKKTTDIKSTFVEADSYVSSFYVEKTSDAVGRYNRPNHNTRHTKKQAQLTLAERMRLQSEVIKSAEFKDYVSIYKIPTIETMRKQNEKIVKKCLKDPLRGRKHSVGGRLQEKVLMLMGATGAGKRTLINGMVNYIMGVEWEDKFRFKLIVDSSSWQAQSVTTEITAYTIPPMEGSALPYSFTIIDTPGYGDTEGLNRDMFITSQIKEFLSLGPPTGIDHLDGIGFVIQSSLARLTPTQTYIFDAILSIFGKDMGNNIFMMVTFADGQHPPILTAVNEANISYQNFFTFNNSALFAPNANSGFDQVFWQMGKASFEEFFAHFQSTKSVKLEQTKKVLDERQQLEILVEELGPQMKQYSAKFEEMRHEQMALQELESQMECNKDYVYTVPTLKTTQIDLRGTGRYTMMCLKCNFTCHMDCKIADANQINECVAIDDDDGNCKVCMGKCYWRCHKSVPYVIKHETVYEKRTSEDLKNKYDMAMQRKNKVEATLKMLDNVCRGLGIKVIINMYEVRLCLHRLDVIALKPNPLTELDYIELLIETERNERKEGYMARIRAYEEVKSKATSFAHIQSAEDILQLVG